MFVNIQKHHTEREPILAGYHSGISYQILSYPMQVSSFRIACSCFPTWKLHPSGPLHPYEKYKNLKVLDYEHDYFISPKAYSQKPYFVMLMVGI